MPSAGFESVTPASDRPQTLALDRSATRIGTILTLTWQNCEKPKKFPGLTGCSSTQKTHIPQSENSCTPIFICYCLSQVFELFNCLYCVILSSFLLMRRECVCNFRFRQCLWRCAKTFQPLLIAAEQMHSCCVYSLNQTCPYYARNKKQLLISVIAATGI